MKIMHCCFSGGYTEECAYQENVLTEMHARHGHEVLVAASDETTQNGVYSRAGAGETVTADGIRVVRLAPSRAVPSPLRYKLRIFPGFERLLDEFAPDIVFFHSMAGYELLTAAKYKREHPGTVLLADSHAANENSGHNFLSKSLLHKGFYRRVYRRVRNDLDAVYYIGIRERDYLEAMLGVRKKDMSLLSLGGIVIPEEERSAARKRVRERENIPEDSVVMCYSGKLAPAKRPEVMLRAMELCGDPRLRLIIAGSAHGEMLDMINGAAAKDGRIKYVGWQTAASLNEWLCASDVYVLPCLAAATVQNALCCGTPVIAMRQYTYTEQFGEDSGMLHFETQEQLAGLIDGMLSGSVDLAGLGKKALAYARENLDYERQASMIENFGRRK